jgi:hypothetical protein
MKTLPIKPASTRNLDKKVKQAKAVLRDLQETLEDFEDRLELAQAIKENAGKPLIPWEVAARDLGIRPPVRKKQRKVAR